MGVKFCTKLGAGTWHCGLSPGHVGECELERVQDNIATLAGTLARYGQHDSGCDAIQPMWHKGPCDCGWSAACKALGIDEEGAGMPEDRAQVSGAVRYTGGRRVDIFTTPELVRLAVTERGAWLVARGYRQISRRYLAVARLPEGMTGQQALRGAFNGDRDAEWIDKLADDAAGNHFRRVYAYYTGAPLVLELDRETYAAFLAAGGESA